jgi:hypothetical protein
MKFVTSSPENSDSSGKREPGQLSHKGGIHPQQRHSSEGGNPGRVTVHGETVSSNEKEPGRQDG